MGVFLAFLSTFFGEISSSIGKRQVQMKEESPFSLLFLNLSAGALFFILFVVFLKKEFIFQVASIPTFGIRFILQIVLLHIAVKGLTQANRSTFGFLHSLTIPLLLIVDFFLGYEINFAHIIGIVVILFALAFLTLNHGIAKRGAKYILATSVLSVGTISLFKYNITNFNTVESEQLVMLALLSIYFLYVAHFYAKENPISFFKKKIFLAQSLSSGLASMASSFAFMFAAPSSIIAIERSGAIFWTIVFGNVYFKEKHIIVKLIGLGLFVVAVILLSFK